MFRTWSDPEGSSHNDLCLGVPFYLIMNMHEEYMKKALKEAEKAKEKDEVPVGCVIVKDGKVIARAHNLREKSQTVVSHAEILAIQKASRKLGTWCLDECDLYVTLEPCMMCYGAIYHSQIRNLYYGASDEKAGCVESLIDVKSIRHIGSHPNASGGYLKDECAQILKDFFKEKRKRAKRKKSEFR